MTTLGGQTKRSTQLSARPKWVLIYVEPGCQPCAEVLRIFDRAQPIRDLNVKVAVIVGGATPEEVKRIAARHTSLPADCWYADDTRAAAIVLKSRGAPVVYGVETGNVGWALVGRLANAKQSASVLLTWLDSVKN